jgi:ankyrin repeat protein
MKKSLLIGSFICFSLPIISMEEAIESTYSRKEYKALITAFKKNDIQEMNNLLASNQFLANSESKYGIPILHRMVEYGDINHVKLFLNYGADVNKQALHFDQKTALHLALSYNRCPITDYLEKAQLLIDHDAEINKKIHLLLYHCMNLNNPIPALKLLLENNADINFPNNILLHNALTKNSPELLHFLLERGAEPNVHFGYYKDTPLHIAVYSFNSLNIHHLLQHGANRHIKNSKGQTPLDVARTVNKHYYPGIIRVITLLEAEENNTSL